MLTTDAIIENADISHRLFRRRQVLSCLASVFAAQQDLEVVYFEMPLPPGCIHLHETIRSNPSHREYDHNTHYGMGPGVSPFSSHDAQALLDRAFFRQLQSRLRHNHVDQIMAYHPMATLFDGQACRMTRDNHLGLIDYFSSDHSRVWGHAALAYAEAYKLDQTTAPALAATPRSLRL